jgi:electron transport complex protein RnfE
MLMDAYVPQLATKLGTFLSLIVVNCLILGRAEAFASKNTPLRSAIDGAGMAIGFTGGIVLLAFFRELFGSGSVTLWVTNSGNAIGLDLIPMDFQIPILIAPAGAFLVFGILVSQINKIKFRRAEQSEVA